MLRIIKKAILLIILIVLVLALICYIAPRQPEPYSLATDLSSLLKNKRSSQSKTITFENLENNVADSILLKKQPTEEAISWLPNKNAENLLIAQHQSAVVRRSKTLSIKTSSGSPIRFRDMYKPEGKDHDGDSTEYLYAGPLAASGYQMVEAEYMHDSPGMYFINPQNRSLLYAHIGDHSVFFSKNNQLLVLYNSLNSPFGFVLTVLSKNGHRVELYCLEQDNKKSNLKFKGWHEPPNTGFDLTFQATEAIPIHLIHTSGKWHIFAPENYISVVASKLTCWQ